MQKRTQTNPILSASGKLARLWRVYPTLSKNSPANLMCTRKTNRGQIYFSENIKNGIMIGVFG
jgi:hypothetical protein